MKLTPKQEDFCILFVKYGDATKAYKEAYKCDNNKTSRTNGYKNLQKQIIKERIAELTKGSRESQIASAEEVLEMLSKVVRGEEKDQFGLEASLSDRIKAGELLLKRYKVFDRIDDKLEALKRKKLELDIEKQQLDLQAKTGGNDEPVEITFVKASETNGKTN